MKRKNVYPGRHLELGGFSIMHPKSSPMVGYWRLVCSNFRVVEDDDDVDDGPSNLDKLWNPLRTIAEEAPSLFSKPPDTSSCRYSTYICCYTPDCTDVNVIRLAAEFIRGRVNYPYVLKYLDTSSLVASERNHLFQHTPEGELYEKLEYGLKLVVATGTLAGSNVLDEFAGLDISTRSKSPDNSHESNEDSESKTLIPSKVFDKDYIFMPSTEEGKAKMWEKKGGKWMVFSPAGFSLDEHDAAWKALVPLCEKGILVGLKASTNVLNKANSQKVRGGFKRTSTAIYCYTADSNNMEDVLQAAVAIREVYNNNYMLFYKLNTQCKGDSFISSYMHTVSGGLYVRDDIKRYELILPKTKCGGES
ncbi:hypothetical protein JTE90_017143 [Oedothorax gibbosus]|uniref:Uncharacterized protein n=1 Tax=Oedothorax gibbosus TaxID=931172 RepID=A0AAV6UD43_9ARAC|nr:hypothetical protein JTE90_017143 [Oedothorax gibbosus]